MIGEPPHTRSFRDKMNRYRGDIDNALYKAEQACESVQDFNACTNEDCPWSDHVKGCKMLGSFTNEFEAFKTYVVATSIIVPAQEHP